MQIAPVLFLSIWSLTVNAMMGPITDNPPESPKTKSARLYHMAFNYQQTEPDKALRLFCRAERAAIEASDRYWAASARIWIGILRTRSDAYNDVAKNDILGHFERAKQLAPEDENIKNLADNMIQWTGNLYSRHATLSYYNKVKP